MRRKATAGAIVAVLVVVIILGIDLGWFGGSAPSAPASPSTSAGAHPSTSADDGGVRELFADRRSGVEVRGAGTVSRVLPDDDEGSRHQKFILRLPDGLTVLVAHNIDIAPRLTGLTTGDTVEFLGQYEWSAQGGTIHWTHHDPSGRHEAGWLRWDGRSYG